MNVKEVREQKGTFLPVLKGGVSTAAFCPHFR